MAPRKTTTSRRVSRRDVLSPAVLQVLKGDIEQRQVLARVTRKHPCRDCDFLGVSPRDLQKHYDTRAKRGFVPGAPKAACFECGERFCMQQSLHGHHTVMHAAGGAFAKLKEAGVSLPLPGQTQSALASAMVDTSLPPVMQPVPSQVAPSPACIAIPHQATGAHSPHPMRGPYTSQLLDFPLPPHDMQYLQNMDPTVSVTYQRATNRQRLEEDAFFVAMSSSSATKLPQEVPERDQPVGDIYQEAEVHTPNTSKSPPRSAWAVGLELLHHVMDAGELDEGDSPEADEDALAGYYRADAATSYLRGRNSAQEFLTQEPDLPQQSPNSSSKQWDPFMSEEDQPDSTAGDCWSRA